MRRRTRRTKLAQRLCSARELRTPFLVPPGAADPGSPIGSKPRSLCSRPPRGDVSGPKALIEKIEALPPERLAEVEDFEDFLMAKFRRLAAMDRLLAVAPELDAAGAPAITEDEIQAEVDAVREARRSRGTDADRP